MLFPCILVLFTEIEYHTSPQLDFCHSKILHRNPNQLYTLLKFILFNGCILFYEIFLKFLSKINSTTLLWRFSLFQTFNCMNNALINIMVHILLWNYIMFSFLWNSFLGMRLVDPTVCEFLFSEDIAILLLLLLSRFSRVRLCATP